MKLSDLTEEVKMPKRSKFGVGKLIGGQLYVHKQYEDEIADKLNMKTELRRAREIASDLDYTIVKFNPKNGAISLLQSDNWDTAPEPNVTYAVSVSANGDTKNWTAPKNGVIYHHKWLFVKDAYSGFDVEESKQRSRDWMEVMANNPDLSYSKIGSQKYWEENVLTKL